MKGFFPKGCFLSVQRLPLLGSTHAVLGRGFFLPEITPGSLSSKADIGCSEGVGPRFLRVTPRQRGPWPLRVPPGCTAPSSGPVCPQAKGPPVTLSGPTAGQTSGKQEMMTNRHPAGAGGPRDYPLRTRGFHWPRSGGGRAHLGPEARPVGARELWIKGPASGRPSQACAPGSWSRALIQARPAALGWGTLAPLGTARRQR